jgi:WS/DGAT/MGAT family acyltransferase
MPGPARVKMSTVDTAWLRMDRPHNLMVVCGVMLFDRVVDHDRLVRIVEERFCVFPRFRQRAVERDGVAYWEEDDHFDVRRHVVRDRLPGRAGRRELQALVSRLVATPLDARHPLWQFRLVDRGDGGSALILRVHHCYADGIALVRVTLSMTDAGPDGPPAMPFAPGRRARGSAAAAAEGMLLHPASGLIDTALAAGASLLGRGAGLLQDPAAAVELANQGGALAAELGRIALMGQDSATRFKGKAGVAKRVAWADPLPLAEVKAVGGALSASVNDVLLSCVTGALRAYLVEKGDPVDGLCMRAVVPVNLRPIEKAWQLGNQFGLVFCDLPIGIENPVERLYAVRANMRALKGSWQPALTIGLLSAIGAAPRALQELVLQALARNGTAVMTNVPGPPAPLYLAGARIASVIVWVPQSGDIGVGVSILSYAGNVQFGLLTDRSLCPDPERVIDRFGPEFEKLLLTTLMSPWPSDGDLDPSLAERAVTRP